MDVAGLQDELTEVVRTWDDRLLSEPGGPRSPRSSRGVPEAYKAITPPARAVEDLRRIAALAGPVDFSVRLCPADGPADRRFTLYLASTPATLTDVLPLLQQLGLDVLDERPSEFVRADGLRVHVYDFSIRLDDATRAALDARPEADIEREFCAAFGAAWRGDVETDRFSALVLRAGLPWREVGGAAGLRPLRPPARRAVRPQYMADTLLAHPDVARGLVALFRARFDPALADDRDEAVEAAVADVRTRIDAVTGLDADRILRSFLAMIMRDAAHQLVPRAPVLLVQDRPVAGAGHARAAARGSRSSSTRRGSRACTCVSASVARGGLRWSDRPQDYRTEVLGLVKAQAVKNAVIVPVGAKGGFVVRSARAPGPRGGRGLLPDVHLRPARRHRQPRSDGADRAAAGRRAPRRRRLLPRGRGRQGHREVLRHRQRGRDVLRLLARRRVRLRRLRRLRPQGDGHHRQGRVGERQAALPRAGRRHADRGVHRRRRRRHVRRRVRQRHAALPAHPAARRVRPPARVRRPRPGRRDVASPSASGCSRCPARRGTTTTAR